VVGESTGDWWTFEDGTEKPKNETPDTLITATDEYLTSLAVTNDDDLSDDQVSQLEALGYI
jgi:hypothetical protein